MPDTVYVTRFGATWHATHTCTALDSARLNEGGHVLQVPASRASDRRPCLVCAGQPGRSEWVLTADNLGELYELIEQSKPHYSYDAGGQLAEDGLTIRAEGSGTGERVVARFGDTIRREPDGRYSVHPAAPTA